MKEFNRFLDLITGNRKKRAKEEADVSKQRIEDLYIKLYRFNDKIEIPIPNLFAEAQIEKFFGGQDKINFEDNEHIARLLFILRNQQNEKLVYFTQQEQDIEVRKIMQEIPAPYKELYQQAIWEMFIALKKNSNRREKEIIQQVGALLTPQAN